MAATKEKPYVEGGISYYTEGENKYKDGRLIPKENWGYLPTAIGGTRGITAPAGLTDIKTPTDTTTPPPLSFSYSPETLDYLGKLQTNISTPFQYNPTTDPLYGPLKEQYSNMGQQAFQNTIGQLSALTGGRPNTAAVGTAANANNQYQQAFAANVLPQLSEQAYNRSQDQRQNEMNLLGVLMNKDTSEFDRKMAIEEFEWSRNENNPTVKAQILANMIAEIDLANLPEQYRLELATAEEQLKNWEIINKYAPAEAEAGLNQTYATIANIRANTERTLNEEKEKENTEPTEEQTAAYSQMYGIFKDMDPDVVLTRLRENENLYVKRMGRQLYDRISEELGMREVEKPEEQATYFEKGTADYSGFMAHVISTAEKNFPTPFLQKKYIVSQKADIIATIGPAGYNELLSMYEDAEESVGID